jgi:F0F1-type ATP synthase assembly protein I
MAKLVVGILIGLVLGLYLDSTATGTGGQPLAQIEAAAKNLFSF